MVISGKELAAACKAKMAEQVKTFPEKYGRLPHLVVVLVGEDAGSVSYVTGKTKAADEVGILNTTIRKPADISEEELLKIIDDLNADDTVDGILIHSFNLISFILFTFFLQHSNHSRNGFRIISLYPLAHKQLYESFSRHLIHLSIN